MPILSANRIGGVYKTSKPYSEASTLEWVLSFCIVIIAFLVVISGGIENIKIIMFDGKFERE